jgi:hypothetical protein
MRIFSLYPVIRHTLKPQPRRSMQKLPSRNRAAQCRIFQAASCAAQCVFLSNNSHEITTCEAQRALQKRWAT